MQFDLIGRMFGGMRNADQNFISKVEVARRLGCDRETIYAAIRRGDLPVDERGRILRGPFMAMIATLANMQLNNGEEV